MYSKEKLSIENANYKISISEKSSKDLVFVVSHKASLISREIIPKLHLVYFSEKPILSQEGIEGSPVVGWKINKNPVESNIFKLNGKDMIASKVRKNGNAFDFSFNNNTYGELLLRVELANDNEAPSVIIGIKASKNGWYSIGFVGLTEVKPEKIDFLYQPLNWMMRRFPIQPCLTEESYCTTAATFLNMDGFTEGIAPDPKMIPYRFALSTFWGKKGNSLFGLALRNNNGMAKPMLFAPLLGGMNSFLESQQTFTFTSKYILTPGNWIAGTEYILQNIFNYKNERSNATLSLNQTLENMINFAMDDRYSGWINEYKGFDYSMDAVGTVKVVSALHALGIALTMGNIEVYKRRALPMIEYVMSREKYLFSIEDKENNQNPSHLLKGPCVEIAELIGLYEMTGEKSAAFRKEAERVFGKTRHLNLLTPSGGGSWTDYMAKYRMTKKAEDLDKAKEGALAYIKEYVNTYPSEFRSPSGQFLFYTDFISNIFDLFELWQITNDKTFLDASHIGARELLLWSRSNPMAPDSIITVNKGSVVEGIFPGKRCKPNSYEFTISDMSTQIAEQKIPAWRTSLVGLTPEASATYPYGPIMLTNYAPWLLRLAEATGDKVLADVAYNAVIGRYANFPGYYYTSLHTNVYQVPDYPMHNYKDIKYNAVFYNHVWSHIALINDFLVSDAYYRSKGKVAFPSIYAPGYAFLSNKVYGHKAGTIFDNENIYLWMPHQALQSCNVAFNHLFGVGTDALYLVLMNTSTRSEQTDIQLNQDIIGFDTDKQYNTIIYDSNGNTQNGKMQNGKIIITVPAYGLSVVKIKDLVANIPLFHKYESSKNSFTNNNYVRNENENELLGTITGMLINFTPDFSDAYIYSDVTEKTTKKAIVKYKIGDENWETVEDSRYPFEFSIHLPDPKQKLQLKWASEDYTGKIVESKEMILENF